MRAEQDKPDAPVGEINPPPKALPEKTSEWTDTTPKEAERVSTDPPRPVDGPDRQ